MVYQKLIVNTLLTEKEKKIKDALKSIGFPDTTKYESLVIDLSEVIRIREILNIPSEK